MNMKKGEIYNISNIVTLKYQNLPRKPLLGFPMNEDQIISTFSTEIFNVTPSWESSVKKKIEVYI